MANAIFVVHILSTFYMFGLIWFVQIVHYPLMAKIDPAHFVGYEQQHTKRTGWVVAPIMIIELVSALGFIWAPIWVGGFIFMSLIAILLIALVGIWLSTFLIQVPLHQSLSQEYSLEKIQRLVKTNWIRTILWTVRVAILAWLIWIK